MKEKEFLLDCQREYSSRKYLITGVSLQEKTKGEHISYDTTHSAFIYTLEGGADINFNDKSFTATPDVVIHGAKNRKITFAELGLALRFSRQSRSCCMISKSKAPSRTASFS